MSSSAISITRAVRRSIFRTPGPLAACRVAALCVVLTASAAFAGTGPYRVLPPIQRQNLAIFPVVAAHSADTSFFLTLDEGVRTGQVVVTEKGSDRGLVRTGQRIAPVSGAEVNRLVLYNNSNRPLLLLAGEIVTGGKQDRIIGADRIVPPNGGPIDLDVFCVEPGRWTGATAKFGSMGAQMAQPSVRMPAMAEHNQEDVWANVRSSNQKMMNEVAGAPSATTSYAQMFASAPVQQRIADYGGIESEHAILNELRSKGAVGVVVAVNGRIVWADLFASTDLLSRYWTKLMRSYAAEAITSVAATGAPNLHDAELCLANLEGGREIAETEPGVFRRTDVTGEGFRVFTLRSLLPRQEFDVHITKLIE